MSKRPSTYCLTPRLPDAAESIYARFLQGLRRCSGQKACQVEATRALLGGGALQELERPDRLSTRFFLEVIADLIEHGWRFRAKEGSLEALAPDATRGSGQDRQEIKRRLRAMLVKARNEQLRESTNRAFIEKMERPRWHRGRQVSVLDLFADGEELASDLRRRLNAPEELQDDLLKEAVQPYLQRVTDDRDEHTGLRLRDIWRYCRYTWSLPHRSQPGRQMHYLVRDGARPLHPIMGIGALGSSIVQISARDSEIGWALSDLEESENMAARVEALETEIDRAVAEIFTADFVEEGALTRSEIKAPTEEALGQLEEVVGDAPLASRERPPKDATLAEAARSPLYRRKRATTLGKLLEARRVFQRAKEESKDAEEQTAWLLECKEGQRALSRALRSLKKRHVGSSMMNITTCGAIPPYNPMLGGKLTSLLMSSPQVLRDYREKYGGRSSHIASRMKGEDLVRENKLVLLETTSLYYVGSSQYNRLRAPAANGELRFNELDEKTKGFGSVHLSRSTYDTLQRLLEGHPNLEQQGYGFGNGVNYKMRSLAAGLGHMGLAPLLKHENPRLIFLIPLATNWREYLNGLCDEPEMLYDDIAEPEGETSKLVEFWKDRWFLMRVKKPFVLRRTEGSRDAVRVSELVGEGSASRLADAEKKNSTPSAPQPSPNGKRSMSSSETPMLPWKSLAELKADRASYAELLSESELSALHVRTKLDDGLVEVVSEGAKRVYLTGNPGDGKTHFIERYRTELEEEGVFVETDASATSEDALAKGIAEAASEGCPALIAVNEGPLRRLLERLPEQDQDELREQLNRPFLYGEGEAEYDAVLINLGLRQVLSPDVVEGVLDLVLNRVDYEDAPEPIVRNADALRRQRVQERLKKVLQLLARSGRHVTMHEVLGFFSHLITGGKKAAQAMQDLPPYYQLAFGEESPFRKDLREVDPVHIAHPLVDMQLWDQPQNGAIEWLRTPGEAAPVEIEDPSEARERFEALKRRYLFEAQGGGELLGMLPDDRNAFYDLLKTSSDARETAQINVIEAISQFFGGVAEADGESRLEVWTGLRYAADGPPTAFVSAYRLSEADIELQVPRLRAQVANLIEYQPSHVQLRLRQERATSEAAPPGLDIDLSLWLELMRIRRGMPPRYRDVVIERRLGRFLSRVATQLRHERGVVRLRVRDLEADATYNIGVLPEQNIYRL